MPTLESSSPLGLFRGVSPYNPRPRIGSKERMFHTLPSHIELNRIVANATVCLFKNATHLEVGLAAQNPLKILLQKAETQMNETQNLSNPDNYIILIQQKYNRAKKIKTKYLTSDLGFTENEKEALQFTDFAEAENFLNTFCSPKRPNSKLRIIVKYKLTEEKTLEKTTSKQTKR